MPPRAGSRIDELFRAICRPSCAHRWRNWCARPRIRAAPRRRGDRRATSLLAQRRSSAPRSSLLMYHAGCGRDRLDADARHAEPLAGAHPDRFRQSPPMCCGRWPACCSPSRSSAAAIAGNSAIAAAGLGDAPAVPVSSPSLVPVLVGDVLKWIVGRGRPFVGGEANAFNFSHFARQRGLCQLSVRPCHHGLCAGFRGFRAMAAGAALDADLCRHDCAQPPGAAGASSERRGGRRAGRRDRRHGWCATGLPRAASASPSATTAPLCRFRGPRWGTSKGLPAGASAP